MQVQLDLKGTGSSSAKKTPAGRGRGGSASAGKGGQASRGSGAKRKRWKALLIVLEGIIMEPGNEQRVLLNFIVQFFEIFLVPVVHDFWLYQNFAKRGLKALDYGLLQS